MRAPAQPTALLYLPGCPSPSSRGACPGPATGTATASQWSTMASRQPSTSPPVSSTSLSSPKQTQRQVGGLQEWVWRASLGEVWGCGRLSQTGHLSPSALPHPSQCLSLPLPACGFVLAGRTSRPPAALSALAQLRRDLARRGQIWAVGLNCHRLRQGGPGLDM